MASLPWVANWAELDNNPWIKQLTKIDWEKKHAFLIFSACALRNLTNNHAGPVIERSCGVVVVPPWYPGQT
jgi:hypothetical protein